MSERTYSQVNTGISVREASFVSPSQFEQLLASPSSESREGLLQGTPYALDSKEIKDLAALEARLMAALLAEYQWAFEVTPQSDLVSLFTLKYTYHNLKVYLKHKATERKLGHLLIPIGPYSLDVLEHLVATFLRSIAQPLWRKKWLQPGKNSKTIRTCGFSKSGWTWLILNT